MAPFVRVVDGVEAQYASIIEGEAQEVIRWQTVQVGGRVNRVVYSQLKQQLIFFGEPSDSGDMPVFISSTAESEGRSSLWALEQTFTMPPTTVFSDTSHAFYNYNVFQITNQADGGGRNYDLRLVNLQCLEP